MNSAQGETPPISARNLLGAVACPLTPRELPTALAKFKLWAETAPPVSADHVKPEAERPRLVFSYNCAPDPALSEPLEEAFRRYALVQNSFAGIDVRFCNLPPEKDLYIRGGTQPPPEFGNKAGPNWLFYETMMALRAEARFVFQMETDCIPITANWLSRIERVCSQNRDAWVIGSQYCGASPLHWSLARHINGNALYQVGDAQFIAFLSEFLWPWMHRYIKERDPDLAYDCAWEAFLTRQEMEHPSNYDWIHARQHLQRFRLSNFIVNIGGQAEQSGQYSWTKRDILARYPDAVIVHGPLQEAADILRGGGFAFGKAVAQDGTVLENSTLGYRGENRRDRVRFERSIWLPGEPVRSGDSLHVAVSVNCGAGAGVIIELCDPNGTPIGRKVISGRDDNIPKRDKLACRIPSNCVYLKLRFRFFAPDDQECDVVVSHPYLELLRETGEVVATAKKLFG